MILDGILVILIIVLLFSVYKHSKNQSVTSGKIDELNRIMKSRNMELVQSEHQFKTFFDELAKPACIFNVNTMRFTQVNKELTLLLGYSKSELLNANLTELMVEEDIESSIEVAYENSKGNNLSTHVNRYITKSNDIISIHWIFSKPDSKGNSFCIAEEIPVISKNLLEL